MYDDAVIQAFLKAQTSLYDEKVADTPEEAKEFLEEICASVCENEDEVIELLEDEMDVSELTREEILALEEVFAVGDGRFLVCEA